MLPLPTAIPRSTGPVPNASAVNWPQAQLAPNWLPPGSPSFQPYSYLKEAVEPDYQFNVPPEFVMEKPLGGFMMLNNPSSAAAKAWNRAAARQRSAANATSSRVKAYRRLLASAGSAAHPPVVRLGARPSGQTIPSGIPRTAPLPVPPAVATAGLQSMYGGIALRNTGDCTCGQGFKGWWDSQATAMKVIVGSGAALVAYRLLIG